jgi:FkbM family methyltransferase
MTAAGKPEAKRTLPRAWHFLQKPWHEKADTLRIRWAGLLEQWRQSIARIPVPVRLPFGSWWLARNDSVRKPIREGQFEAAELAFVERFLRPGMTVLDLGAHYGLYTLLASKRVGRGGQVFAFEPSPRERKGLRLHLWLNRCKNVIVRESALGDEATESALYVVEDWAAGCNSLRPPAIPGETFTITVQVVKLDDWLAEQKINRVDFIKLDVEGGELAVLKGAAQLLERHPRPLIMAEVQDVRTRPWGYRARDILDHLGARGYHWFRLLDDGSVEELDLSPAEFEGNFVACPEEREAELHGLSGGNRAKVSAIRNT